MPEMREVFEMTTKQIEPDVDMFREQEKRQRRSSRNRKIGAFAVAAAIGLVAVVFVLVNGNDPREVPVPADPPTSAPNAPTGPVFVDLRSGDATPLPDALRAGALIFASPDRTMFVYSECCGSPNGVFVTNVDGTGVRQITPDGTDGFAARWSPDGSMLVYQQRDGFTQEIGNLVVVDVATGETTPITDLDRATYGLWMLSPSFSPDGERVLFHLPRGPNDDPRWDLWSAPVGGGEPTLEVRDASMGVYAPDGRIAYVDSPRGEWTSPRLIVRDPDGTSRLLVEGNEIDFARWSPDGTKIAYSDMGAIHVVDVSTGDVTEVADEGTSDWFGDDTLIVVPRV